MQLCASLDLVRETLEIQPKSAEASANSWRRTAEKRRWSRLQVLTPSRPRSGGPSSLGSWSQFRDSFSRWPQHCNVHPLHLPEPLPRGSQLRALGLGGPGQEISPVPYQPWDAMAQVHLPLGLGREA